MATRNRICRTGGLVVASSGVIAALILAAGACKSRSSIGGGAGSDLRDAGSGSNELDKVMAEFEVVDCTAELCGDGGNFGDADTGAGGVSFANPAAADMQVAFSGARVRPESNPFGDLDYGGGFDTSYALVMKSGGAGADGEALDQVAAAWTGFNAAAMPMDRSQIVASSLESFVSGILGPEVIANPDSLDPVRLADALDRLERLFADARAGRIGEPEVVGALDMMLAEGGLGHPTFNKAAAFAIGRATGKSRRKQAGALAVSGAVSKADPGDSGSGSLSSIFGNLRWSELLAMQSYYSKNMVAATPQKKSELIARMRALVPTVRKIQATLMRFNLSEEAKSALMDTARVVAGQDGFINHGDLPRLLPVVPQLVGEIADQKIDEGLADGIAQLRSQRPFVYRRWARAPNGLIGRAVNREINRKLNDAYGQKYAAINAASAELQKLFNAGMAKIGTDRYFVGSDSPKNYYDPAKALELPQVERVVRMLTGRTLRSIAEEAAANGGNMQMPPVARELSDAADKLFAEVELPDGIFVADSLFAIQQKIQNPDALVLPQNIQVVLANNGKIRIGQRREACSCEYTPKHKQCVFLFTPIVNAGEKNQVRYYQPLGPGYVPTTTVQGRGGRQVVQQAGAEPQCDDQSQCAAQFTDRNFNYYVPHACGGYFWTKPGNVLYTTP